MAVTIRSSGGPATEQLVGQLESRLGFPLPNDYRAFLLANNAREISPCSIPVSNIERTSTVTLREMCCFCPGQACDIFYTLDSYEGRIPSSFLPIGDDPGGNVFIMALDGDSRGSIWFWIHEFEGDEDEPPTMDNVYPLAKSFTEFLDNLI